MTVLQATACVPLWQAGFDTADIAAILGGVAEADVQRVLDVRREAMRPSPRPRLVETPEAQP